MFGTTRGKGLVVVLVFALLLAAASSATSAARKTRVTVWSSHSGEPGRTAIDHIVEAFNKQSATLEVIVEVVPGAETDIARLTTAIAGKVGPDVYLLDRFCVAERAATGLLECLDPLIAQAKWDAEKEFLPFAWAETLFKGKCYALPWDTDDRALFYRPDFCREVGLNPAKPPTTIAELDAWAEKLTRSVGPGRYTRLGLVPWLSQGWHYMWGWVFGGEFYDAATKKLTVNEPRIVESFAWQKSYSDKYNIEAIDSFSSTFGGEVQAPFITGQIAMFVMGNWDIAFMAMFGPQTEWAVTPIPTKPGVPKTTWAGGWSMVIPKGAKHPNEAFEFIRFACGEPGQTIYSKETLHFSTLKSLANAPWLTLDPRMKVFLDLLPAAKCRPPLPVGGLLWDELTAARDYAIHGQKTPQKALDDVVSRVQPELDKYMK